ncbi:hypothetical protein BGZ65_003913 [Modicella reniformis]|uniref:Arm-like repeat domain-containing protein n=1 Tax=Modicella reniformis TaxID=1440133 RepID=A0A9P6SVP2_9FUNG|nr:hypothetical protein BGZ65_003913 [Modicella reniformis]
MWSRSIVPSPKTDLSLRQALEITDIYLKNASKSKDQDIALILCHDAEVALAQAKSASKKVLTHPKDDEEKDLREGMAAAYINIGNLLELQEYRDEAQLIYKKAGKLGWNVNEPGRRPKAYRTNNTMDSVESSLDSTVDTLAIAVNSPSRPTLSKIKQQCNIATVPSHIFPNNVRPFNIQFKLPEADERLNNTLQLACCLGLLKTSFSTSDVLEPTIQHWLQAIEQNKDEQERLNMLATDVFRAFKRDELKDTKAVAEIMYLAPILGQETFRDLLADFYDNVKQSDLLDFHQLDGLAQLIQGADPGYLFADDLVTILKLLSDRLIRTHDQSEHHVYQLTLTVSHVLDAMANTKVKDLDRETLHAPLASYLDKLKSTNNPYLIYQAAYAHQALLCVPDNEKLWQGTLRRTGKVIQGISGLVSAVKALDLSKFIEGLGNIQQGFAGATEAFRLAQAAYENVSSLAMSGKDFLDCLQEGFSFERQCAWYSALRGADALIRDGEVASFRILVCKAPCRYDLAFQWGVCQRLSEIASNPMWDADTRRSAVAFLGEIYQNDAVWGQHVSVKQWILDILMQLASSSDDGLQLHSSIAETLLLELDTDQDTKKQAFYNACRVEGSSTHPLKATLPALGSSSLLDRVQNRPDVESALRLLKKQRLKERGNAVYIRPQAKANLQATDDTAFPLMEKVQEFLDNKQKVFLVLGDSGAGKSTFNRELEYQLWDAYKSKDDRIPLHINLPSINKPEHDMIAKRLRKAEFTEHQIKELKLYRKFILICDGYDESQQTQNLYMSNRLNESGEWTAQMIISCRTEYLGVDYRHRFQPGDRNQSENHNQSSKSSPFQEAIITPFSVDQIQEYIKQYVSANPSLWQIDDYKKALEDIPTLKELLKNPFLMALSLEVLPRMMDSGQQRTVEHLTRVELYDQFIVQWLEREKKRIGGLPLSPQAKAAFESLNDEGFTQNGIRFLKKLATAIYKEQDGQPIVSYSRDIDESSWKAEFFSRDDEKQLLRDACPLRRGGNQFQFIHRSLLEYGLTLAVFDPHDWKQKARLQMASTRRGSVSSTLSFEIRSSAEEGSTTGPDPSSPLVWRSFVKEPSLLQFLEERVQLEQVEQERVQKEGVQQERVQKEGVQQERVQQEPLFKKQLLAYIEHSKTDKKWRTAAANAITILVKSGEQFNKRNLCGIRIPGADLSHGVFDSAQLQGSDLRKVDLRNVWLHQADLSGANMTGVQLPFLAEDSAVYSCTYSADGKWFAVGLGSGYISMHETPNWKIIRTLNGHSGTVNSVMFSPEGDQITSGSDDNTVRLWDANTGDCQQVFIGHSNCVNNVAYSPRGGQVASASDDKTVRLWDVKTGDCLKTLIGHSGGVYSAVYSPKGNQIASSSADKTIRLWDVETGECCRTLSDHSKWVWNVVYSPRGDLIASASGDATVRLWDVETGTCRYTLRGHTSHVYSVVFSPKGDRVASGSHDATVRLWDVETGGCRQTLTGHSSEVTSVVYSPKGDQMATGSIDQTVRLWDVRGTGITNVKCSPRGDQIATSSFDSTIHLWDVKTGTCSTVLRGHNDSVLSIAYSPQGEILASGSADNSVRLWNIGTGYHRLTLSGHSDWVRSVAYSSQGDEVASASDDKTVRLWDVVNAKCLWTLNGHTDAVYSVVYSPNGKQIASGSSDNTIRLWDVETGSSYRTLSGHSSWVKDIVYSPRGDLLVSASYDKTLRVWDVETGDYRRAMTGHTDAVTSVRYSPKGDLLVSGSSDNTVRLWDMESGQCRVAIPNHQDVIMDIAWCSSSDTHKFVTGCGDGSVFMWHIKEEETQFRTHIYWNCSGAMLTIGASMQDRRGLGWSNKQPLKQFQGVGEPVRLREASKKVASMISVVSKLKLLSGGARQESTSV